MVTVPQADLGFLDILWSLIDIKVVGRHLGRLGSVERSVYTSVGLTCQQRESGLGIHDGWGWLYKSWS